MDKIIFADNSEYECEFCGLASVGILFIILKDVDFLNAASIFSNTAKTREIIFRQEELEDKVLTGYSMLQYLTSEPNGIRAALRKPYEGETT